MIRICHQVDSFEGKVVGECWLLDGVSKKAGVSRGIQNQGWTWVPGRYGAGTWETKDKTVVETWVALGVSMIETGSKS